MSARLSAILKASTIALLVLGAGFACGGGVGDTGRPITNDELTKMVLSRHQFGAEIRGFAVAEGNGPQTVDSLAADDFDPEDERADLTRSGFEAGYDEAFVTTGDPAASGGVFNVGSGILQFADTDGATGYIEDSESDLLALPGKANAQGSVVVEATAFDASSDSEAGAHVVMTRPDGSQFHGSELMFRHGRLVGYVWLLSIGGAEFDRLAAEARVSGFAEVMDQQVKFALAGSNVADQSSDGPLFVSNASDALGKSAEQFEDKVDSFSGEFAMSMSGAGGSFGANGTMAYQAPDRFYMVMTMSGTDGTSEGTLDGLGIEMIASGDTIYMSTPFTGWVSMSLDDDGAEELAELLDDRGLVDYAELIDEIGSEVEDLGIEAIDGGNYRHYRVVVDVAEIADVLAGTLESSSSVSTAGLDSFFGPMTLDIWMDRDTLLPHRVITGGVFGEGATSVTMNVTMTFGAFGMPVSIPEPPADVPSIDDAFTNLGFDEEGFEEAFGELTASD